MPLLVLITILAAGGISSAYALTITLDGTTIVTDTITADNFIGPLNPVTGANAFAAGGSSNTASGGWSTIGGGLFNTASGQQSTVGGGAQNTASGLQTQIDSNDSDILQLQTDVSDVDGRVTIIENIPTSNHLYVIQFGNDPAIGTVQNNLEHTFDRQMITKGGTLTEVQYGHGEGRGAIQIGDQVLAKVFLNDIQIGSCTTVIAVDEQICDLNITPVAVSRGDMLEITDFGIVTNSLNSALDVTEKYGSATVTLD